LTFWDQTFTAATSQDCVLQGATSERTRHGVTESESYEHMKADLAPSTGKTIWGIVLILGETAVSVGCVFGIRYTIRHAGELGLR
jgi:hypothetical protein